MPVEKYEDPEEARRALWLRFDDPRLPDRIRRVWSLARRLTDLRSPRGVRKYRSIEEANREREERVRRRTR